MNPRLPRSAATLTFGIALLSSLATPELHDRNAVLPVVQHLADLCCSASAPDDGRTPRRQFPVVELLRQRAATN